ncbi:MAG TPA: hypothetical protein VFO76_09425, partial [Candidatus Kapabacteria bacterium]|nr:hypothetical protein [Candidatus Kapabacteria bacterium]
EVTHIYNKAGSYMIAVSAFDYFADTLIASNSIPARINEPATSVQIYPHNIDTVLQMNSNGLFNSRYFSITVATALNPNDLIFNYHVFGGGIDTQLTNASNQIIFPILLEEKYTISTEVVRKSGGIYGHDTSYITIKMPPVSLQQLQAMNKLTVRLFVDTATSVAHSPGFSNPLAIGLLTTNGVLNHNTWSGTTLSSIYYFNQISPDESIESTDSIICNLSSDIKTIPEIRVSVDDNHKNSSMSTSAKWGFVLKNLKLFAVTPTSVIYIAKDVTTDELISDIHFQLTNEDYSDCGAPDTIIVQINAGNLEKLPNAFVSFSR